MLDLPTLSEAIMSGEASTGTDVETATPFAGCAPFRRAARAGPRLETVFPFQSLELLLELLIEIFEHLPLKQCVMLTTSVRLFVLSSRQFVAHSRRLLRRSDSVSSL